VRILAEQAVVSSLPAVQGLLQGLPEAPPSRNKRADKRTGSANRPSARLNTHTVPANANLPPSVLPAALAPLIDRTARLHDIDPLLLHAIARVESRHQPGAVSHAGAHGLMQVIVPTAQRFGVANAQQLHDPHTNLQVSAKYLKTLQTRFGNNLRLVLAAYNAGEGAVEKHGWRVPPYPETQGYVRKVLSEYAWLRRVHQHQTNLVLTTLAGGLP